MINEQGSQFADSKEWGRLLESTRTKTCNPKEGTFPFWRSQREHKVVSMRLGLLIQKELVITNTQGCNTTITHISILLNRWAIWADSRSSKSVLGGGGEAVVVVVAVGEVEESIPPPPSPSTLEAEEESANATVAECSRRRWRRSNSQEQSFRRRRSSNQVSGRRARECICVRGGTCNNGVSVKTQDEDVLLCRRTG